MFIRRLAALVIVLASSTSVITAQTAVPTPSATQTQGTPAPTAIIDSSQGTPVPTAAGTPAGTTSAPSLSIPPSTAPVAPSTSSPTRSLGRPECNICGEGTQNLIGEPNAVVNYPEPDAPEQMLRFPCQAVQQLVNTRNVYKREDVCSYIFTYTYDTCRCITPQGDLLSDVLTPTIAPAKNGGEPQDGSDGDDSGSGTGNGDSDGEDSSANDIRNLFAAIVAGTVVAVALL